MVVIGLDLSILNTGFAVSQESEIKTFLIKDKTKSMPKEKKKDSDYQSKFEYEFNRVCILATNIIDEIKKYKPKAVVIEGLAFGIRNTTSLIQLTELACIIKLYLRQNNIPIYVVAPTELKKFITGKGNAQKDLMLMNIYKKYKIEFQDNNEADAFSLVKYFLSKK